MITEDGYKRYNELASKLLDGTITDSERREYMDWLNKEDRTDLNIPEGFAGNKQELESRILSRLNNHISGSSVTYSEEQPYSQPTVYRVHFLKTTWFRYAAILLVLAGTATFLYKTYNKPQQETAKRQPLPLPTIQPGGNRALLTLADGRTIILDSAANGQLAVQGGVKVVKLANGQVTYDLRGLSSQEVMWNTMTTPKGGQYQVTLPDETKVWLNASSSITFPTAFTGPERLVKIVGEMYFEVAKNGKKPFVVDVDGKSSIEVLGTSFNVNAYQNEDKKFITLLEGSVQVKTNQQQVIMKPGQQANVNEKIALLNKVDINQVMAWKNGAFNFENVTLEEAMRQLERWYDIQVEIEKGVSSDVPFYGKISRKTSLNELLKALETTTLKFRIDGNKLIITK